ncbi:MAG: hypothetical protein K6T94_11330 [Paenibacillus sp.]|nr:hypothetical protein [Paenibacillus sp.]
MDNNKAHHSGITTYEEATEIISELGIIPLATLLPDHPSINSLTQAENWHTGSEFDPWLWRARFPGEGIAAYGKFIKKKAILISRDWFPVYLAAIGSESPLEVRYNNGLCSREALNLLRIVREDEGIETRSLRSEAGMKAKEQKTAFDNAVTELQGSLDIVISGVKARHNGMGEVNGWNSTSFETVSHWMDEAGITPFEGSREEAVDWLKSEMDKLWSPAAKAWIYKVWGW